VRKEGGKRNYGKGENELRPEDTTLLGISLLLSRGEEGKGDLRKKKKNKKAGRGSHRPEEQNTTRALPSRRQMGKKGAKGEKKEWQGAQNFHPMGGQRNTFRNYRRGEKKKVKRGNATVRSRPCQLFVVFSVWGRKRLFGGGGRRSKKYKREGRTRATDVDRLPFT